MNIVLVTGGFDPIHSGHIEYFKAAKQLGDKLIVGLNSDEWLTRKKGRPFMPYYERMMVVGNLTMVDETITYDDSDDSSRNAIHRVRQDYPDANIIFANGGDRQRDNIPEMDVKDNRLSFAFSVGGNDKKNSSSWILQEWKQPKTLRSWGYYRILHDVPGCKVKELTVEPGKSLSMQRHFKRNEYWLVTHGMCQVASMTDSGYRLPITLMNEHHNKYIPKGEWHQLYNPHSIPCRIVEVQYGEECVEEDIERKDASS